MSALKDILAKKTDSQLRYYIEHVDKHTDEAVRVALAELQLRNAELPDDIVDVVELKLREKAAIKIEEKKAGILIWYRMRCLLIFIRKGLFMFFPSCSLCFLVHFYWPPI